MDNHNQPLIWLPIEFKGHTILPAFNLKYFVGSVVNVVGWLSSASQTTTKHGEPMKFLTLSDESAIYDVTVWPNVYKKYGHVFGRNERAFFIKGKVTKQFETSPPVVEAIEITLLHRLKKIIRIFISETKTRLSLNFICPQKGSGIVSL